MYLAFDDNTITPQHFIVCNFYGVETLFCWDSTVSTLITFPYNSNDNSPHDVRVISTPATIRRIQCFDYRIFVICDPQGAYKLSRAGVFALLSKNALEIGNDYGKVLIAEASGLYLHDKRLKSSKPLFQYSVTSSTAKLRAYVLILENTEQQLVNCFISDRQIKDNICVITYDEKVFALFEDSVQLIHTIDSGVILNIVPVKQEDKVAGLLLFVNLDTVILVHGRNQKLTFEKIQLRRKVRCAAALCAGFSSQSKEIVWIAYCDRFKLYYVKKELFIDKIQEVEAKNRSFVCLQYYKPNVILGLSERKELVELDLQTFENSLYIDDNIELYSAMFQKTNPIMDKICSKVKELDLLYETLTNEQDKLRRINFYSCKQKLKVNPHIEVSKMWNQCYLTLNIPSQTTSQKLPKNSYVIFALDLESRYIFSIKKVTEEFIVNMPINRNIIQCSSTFNIDLITLINEEAPWCVIKNFINYSSQTRKKRLKEDKITFINGKISWLQNLIAKKDLNLTKLSEIKKIVRAEL